MLFRKFRPHSVCALDMKDISVQRTAKKRDDLVYVFDGCYHLYKVKQIDSQDQLVCQEFNVAEKVFSRHLTLNFGHVGVFRNLGMKTNKKTLKKSDLSGKVLLLRDLLLTIPKNVLTEI